MFASGVTGLPVSGKVCRWVHTFASGPEADPESMGSIWLGGWLANWLAGGKL